VDRGGGGVTEIAAAPSGGEDGEDWTVWSHPRVSPDGSGSPSSGIAAGAGGSWCRVDGADARRAGRVALPGSPVALPAWAADGTRLFATADASGIWNVSHDQRRSPHAGAGTGTARQRTRVTGARFSGADAGRP
jgi:hypothetical protein